MTPKLAATQLRLMGWGFIIFGVVFVTISLAGYDGFARRLTGIFDWTGAPRTDVLGRDARWFAAIMSGMSAAIGVLYAFVIAPLLSSPDLKARQIAKRGGLIAAFTWYIVDSLGSFGAGVPSNVAMNTLFLLGIALPLVMVKWTD